MSKSVVDESELCPEIYKIEYINTKGVAQYVEEHIQNLENRLFLIVKSGGIVTNQTKVQ